VWEQDSGEKIGRNGEIGLARGPKREEGEPEGRRGEEKEKREEKKKGDSINPRAEVIKDRMSLNAAKTATEREGGHVDKDGYCHKNQNCKKTREPR